NAGAELQSADATRFHRGNDGLVIVHRRTFARQLIVG
ncbi:MAG: hypothetical protein JWP18_1520, partial [Solirubrobacterales bacterium]|nr:hypothetical protein [Solirubrobacterales bacterium]